MLPIMCSRLSGQTTSMRRTEAGFTLLEWALVTTLIGLLITVFLYRLLDILVDAERVKLLQVEAGIKSALGLELAQRVVEKRLDSIHDLESTNPVDLLHEAPHNYLGSSADPDLAVLPEGAWVFDTARGVLIYTIKHADFFQTDLPGRPRSEYRLELNYEDSNKNSRFDFKIDRLLGVNLASIGQYQWTMERE